MAAVSARVSDGSGSSSGSMSAVTSSSISTLIRWASVGTRESSAASSAIRSTSSRSSGLTEITRQPAASNTWAVAPTGKYSDRIATSPHIRMACRTPAGISTARPGGIIQVVRSPVTVIAPVDANSS